MALDCRRNGWIEPNEIKCRPRARDESNAGSVPVDLGRLLKRAADEIIELVRLVAFCPPLDDLAI